MLQSVLTLSHVMRIDAPIEDLWSLITKPGNLNLFHPFCKSNEVTKWNNEITIIKNKK